MQTLILASSSAERLKLLQSININPDLVISPLVDETALTKEKPFALVKRLSLLKLNTVKATNPNSFIIGADTVVVRGSKILGKPKDFAQAKYFIEQLSGRNHKVITGFSICNPKGQTVTKVIRTTVAFKRITQIEINYFLQLNQWQNRCGAYSINDYAQVFVKQIIGSYSNVVGLPLFHVYNVLTGLGFNPNLKLHTPNYNVVS